tara:strand:+ start:124 stop:417 length:294 start_codon:yes stop_codon:yes gene_type:complete
MTTEYNYQKKYYNKNREHICSLRRQKYKEEKDDINKKIKCDVCGRVVIARMYKKHLTTNIHNRISLQPKPVPQPINKDQCTNITKRAEVNNGWISFR